MLEELARESPSGFLRLRAIDALASRRGSETNEIRAELLTITYSDDLTGAEMWGGNVKFSEMLPNAIVNHLRKNQPELQIGRQALGTSRWRSIADHDPIQLVAGMGHRRFNLLIAGNCSRLSRLFITSLVPSNSEDVSMKLPIIALVSFFICISGVVAAQESEFLSEPAIGVCFIPEGGFVPEVNT